MKAVLGLGNPGREFARTRHNVGHWCIDALAKRRNLSWERRRLVTLTQLTLDNESVVLAKSRTFMNLSGQAAQYLKDRFQVKPQDLLVVYDDIDLPVGVIRLRLQGSSGGHKGMDSIIAALGTPLFPRLRIGIGRPSTDAVEHVLGSFTPAERELVQEAVAKAAQAVEVLLTEGVEAAMNRFNR